MTIMPDKGCAVAIASSVAYVQGHAEDGEVPEVRSGGIVTPAGLTVPGAGCGSGVPSVILKDAAAPADHVERFGRW